jgi:hypothetical protein
MESENNVPESYNDFPEDLRRQYRNVIKAVREGDYTRNANKRRGARGRFLTKRNALRNKTGERDIQERKLLKKILKNLGPVNAGAGTGAGVDAGAVAGAVAGAGAGAGTGAEEVVEEVVEAEATPTPESTPNSSNSTESPVVDAGAGAGAGAAIKRLVKVRESLADGNCFYSSVYRALREREGLLERVSTCLGLDATSETSFIATFRNKLADIVASGYLPSEHTKNGNLNAYDMLSRYIGENSYRPIIQNYPSWFKEEFGTKGETLGDKDSFRQRLAVHIRTDGEWVGEIEVRLALAELEKCNIRVEIHKRLQKLLQLQLEGRDVIHVYNPRDVHYTYFSFDTAPNRNSNILHEGNNEVIANEGTALSMENNNTLSPKATVEAAAAEALEKEPACPKLFDPCTKEPIANMATLEKRIREIKKDTDAIPTGLYGLTNKTSNYEFIMNVFVNPAISLDNMVSFRLAEGGQVGSDIFEVLCRLFVFLGGIKDVNPRTDGNYKFMRQIEDSAPEIYESSIDALRRMSCKATRAMGISDITLIHSGGASKSVKPTDPYCEVECDTIEAETIKTYIMSVKWYKKEKNAEHYDLEKLFTAGQRIVAAEGKPLGIIVFLKSKTDFQVAHNRSYRQYVREIGDTFFGWNENVKPFLEERRRELFELAAIKSISTKDAFTSQYLIKGAKPALSLQLHQDIIVKGVCDAIDENRYTAELSSDNLYLIGVLPRGGKTFIAGGIIREYLSRTEAPTLNIFWLTAAPTETMTQVKDELLNRFQDFEDFEFIDAKSGGVDITGVRPTKRHRVIFCSSQLLIATQKPTHKKQREHLQRLLAGEDKFGLVFFDEAHKTGTGDKTKAEITALITTYATYKLPFIFLTATYYNILFEYKIQKNNTFVWDYTDVLMTRALATESEQEEAIVNLQRRFGELLVNSILEKRKKTGETLETMAKAYIGFPDLYFLSLDFNEEAIERFAAQDKYRPESGFRLGSIFAIRRETTIGDVMTAENKVRRDAYRIFENIDNPRNMISVITHVGEFEKPVDDEKKLESGAPLVKDSIIEPTILGRINRASRESESRFRLDERPTLLMFMPVGGEGTNIFYLLCAWASLLMNHTYWKENYEVACVVEGETLSAGDIARLERDIESSTGIHIIRKNPKANVLALERKLHCVGVDGKPKGLVILAGEKLSMGISLPCTDVVFLLNEKKTPDDIIQKMYRALTPSPGKKSAYVVDLNPVRTLAALYGYTRASHESTNTPSQILDIIYDTYVWDADVFEANMMKGASAKPLTFQQRLRELFEKAEKDDEYKINEDLGGYEKQLGVNIRRHMNASFVSTLKGAFSGKKLEAAIKQMGLKEGTTLSLSSGKLTIRVPKEKALTASEEGNNSNTDESTVDTTEIVIDNFVETLADFIKYVSITSSKSTFKDAIAEYAEGKLNSEGTSLQQNVLKLVRARTPISGTTNDKLLSNILLAAINIFASSSSEQIFRQMKGKIDEKSTRKDKILAIIHRRLTPRQKQKKDFGEVFTPIELIETMLSHLPSSDWSNPNLKWLDPANGIGNFPVVVFYKLDEGLRTWEPNDKKRRTHIIKNMLYMMEMQSNNNRIARNIFSSLCSGCEPNIWTVDSLSKTKEQIFEHFGIDKIDRVVGNPPFQAFQKAEGKRGGGDELYMSFVKHFLQIVNENGYLVFVHPPSWRKPEFSEGRKKSKNTGMFDLMAHQNQLEYLEIHDATDGMKVFKAGTRYDFYVLKKTKASKKTTIKDMLGHTVSIDLTVLDFLPNFNIPGVMKLSSTADSKCELGKCVLYERSAYGSDKDWVSATETATYKYPLIHSTPKGGPRFYYSSVNNKGFFHISKVIFGDSGINEPVIDLEGKYGMTQHAIAITVKNRAEADRLVRFLKSNYFTNVLKACMWSGFQIDWRLFTYFKNHFWNEDVVLDEALVDIKEERVPATGGRRRLMKTRKLRRS